MQNYLDYSKERHSKGTYKEKITVFKNFGKFLKNRGYDIRFEEISIISKGMCFEYLQKQYIKRSGYSANRDRKNLAAAYSWGVKYYDFESNNPFLAIEKFPEIKQDKYIPPIKDFWSIYNACTDKQDKLMLLTFLYTAGRRNEIFRLTWDDINFENDSIILKTKKREQSNFENDSIPLMPELKINLLDWQEKQPIKTKYIFTCLTKNQKGKNHKDYGKPFVSRQKFLSRLCKTLNIKPFGYHSIRHLTATILYKNGAKLYDIQAILRHKSAATTQKYLHKLGLSDLKDEMIKYMPKLEN